MTAHDGIARWTDKCIKQSLSDEAVSIAATLSWNTFLSRTSVSSLSTAAFSDSSVSGQVHGLDDVLNTVRALSLRRFQCEEIERQAVVGEGVTFVVERCVVRGQVLAIKHLKNKLPQDDGAFRRRLQSVILELRIMRHAPLRNHPNIIPVFGYGWNMRGNQIAPYLLVQYASYGTLRQYLQHFKSEISVLHKEILLSHVAAAIHALHLCGIIHGDIKLDNVLVFHSWDNLVKPIAKISDFGHSLIISGKDSEKSYLRYGGTFIYNAPEVHSQNNCPIDRQMLHKCDIWAFGILIWEAFLDGDEYVKHIPDVESYGLESREELILKMPHKFLHLARSSLSSYRADVRTTLSRAILFMTLQVDPAKRISDITKLPFLSKWYYAGVQGLKSEMALHFGNSEWSYEMFRSENGKEILWEHEEQIYQGLRQTYNGSYHNGDAAWQLALCRHIGFGDSPSPEAAYQLALEAEELNHPVATMFAPLLAPIGPPESYDTTRPYARIVTKLLLQNETITEKLYIVEACPSGDTECVLSALKRKKVFGDNVERECSILHLLFMLEDEPLEADVLKYLHSSKESLPLDQPTKSIRVAHTQWPLRLIGSPLSFAISVGSAKTVRELISLGANPCSRAFAPGQFPESDHRSKWTPIHIAAQYHCHEILSDLLQIASSTGYESEIPYACALSYSSSLERIAMHGNRRHISLEKTISILKETQDLSAATPSGMTALMQAIDFQDTEVVSTLLAIEQELARLPFLAPSNPKVFNPPIHFAAQIGARRDVPRALEIVEILDNHTQVLTSSKAPLDSAGRTPLHFAVTGPSKRVSTWILEKNSDLVHVKDQNGRTALHYCYSAANVDLLLSRGIDIDHTDLFGLTTLHLACLHGKLNLVRCLVERKSSLNLKNNCYGTPLHCAIIQGMLEMAIALLEAGAPVNEVDRMGNSPLHVASSFSRHSIIRLLLRHNADIHLKNAKGHTAATTAKNLGAWATLKVLEENPTQNIGPTDTFYDPYMADNLIYHTLPVYNPTMEAQSPRIASRESDLAIVSLEPIDYAGGIQADTEWDIFSADDENETDSQEKRRKLALFVYQLNAQNYTSLHEARYIVHNLVPVFEAMKKADLDKFVSAKKQVFEKMLSGDLGHSLMKANLLATYLCAESGMDKEKVVKICDTVDEKNRMLIKTPWHSVGKAVAVILELGRPMWDIFGFDDEKAASLVLLGRKIDLIAETSSELAARFNIPFEATDDSDQERRVSRRDRGHGYYRPLNRDPSEIRRFYDRVE